MAKRMSKKATKKVALRVGVENPTLSYTDAVRGLCARSPAANGATRAARLGAFLVTGRPEAPAASNDGLCTRCGGTGDLPHFRHVENGVCFRCEGSGLEPSREVYLARKAAKKGRRAAPAVSPHGDVPVSCSLEQAMPGTWAGNARLMAQGDSSGFAWDVKDENKEADLRG